MEKKIIIFLAVAFVLLSIGCVQETVEPVACTEEARICPDGSAVGRVPPDCDFAPCPTTTQPVCAQGEVKTATCPDDRTTYDSENCVDGRWVTVKYLIDPCFPLSTAPEESKTWVEIDPVQCMGNPWEQDWLNSHDGDYSQYPKDREFEVIKDYYKRSGIEIFDIKSERKYEVVCMACSCPRGDGLYLLISDSDVNTVLELGYKISDYT